MDAGIVKGWESEAMSIESSFDALETPRKEILSKKINQRYFTK
jgi:hypothetical protein